MALVVRDIWKALPILSKLFRSIRMASHLELNVAKTILIPYFEFALSDVADNVRVIAPDFAEILIKDRGVPLGLDVGPGVAAPA